jgi:hypothetical protein
MNNLAEGEMWTNDSPETVIDDGAEMAIDDSCEEIKSRRP